MLGRLVQVYDILFRVFSRNREEHLVHVRMVLEPLRHHKLYAKASKYRFCSNLLLLLRLPRPRHLRAQSSRRPPQGRRRRVGNADVRTGVSRFVGRENSKFVLPDLACCADAGFECRFRHSSMKKQIHPTLDFWKSSTTRSNR